ncbi:MAG: hypothetical protein ACRDL7_11660, partial [Gaiellaceae bacterium]
MRTSWRDGDRTRDVEVTPLGNDRYRVAVDGTPFEIGARRLPGGRLELDAAEGRSVAEVSASGKLRFVRLGTLDYVLSLDPAGRRR